MGDNLLDVLMYIFERYMEEDTQIPVESSELMREMVDEGFDSRDVDRALNWLDELQVALGDFQNTREPNNQATRIFHPDEYERIMPDAIAYLTRLEHNLKIIDATSRELILDRAFELHPGEKVDKAEMKWLSLMVLFSRPELKDQLAQLEALVLMDYGYVVH